MAAVTHGISTASTTNNAATYTSGSFSPAVGDLLVAFVHARASVSSDGSVALNSVTESLTFTMIRSALKASSTDKLFLFVADALIAGTGARTVVFSSGDDATASGNIIQVARVSGMSKVGATAVRQSAILENQAGGSDLLITFAVATLTTNPVLGMVGNAANPAAVTPPGGSWAEQDDTGFGTPSTGSEYVSIDSGSTSTFIVWGTNPATAFAALGVELDASGAEDPLRWQPAYLDRYRVPSRMIPSGTVPSRGPVSLGLSDALLAAWHRQSWQRAA